MKTIAVAAVVVAIAITTVIPSAGSSTRAATMAGATPTDEGAAVAHAAVERAEIERAEIERAEIERAEIERAVADYAEALYDVRPDLIERSVHRELTKRGFFRDDAGAWQESIMTYEELHALAGEWNAERNVTVEQSPWRVRLIDVFDQTATALLTAHWGIDHMQLARYDGRWQIVQVLWQVPPQ